MTKKIINIISLWIMWFSLIMVLGYIIKDNFLIRTIIIFPFTYICMGITMKIFEDEKDCKTYKVDYCLDGDIKKTSTDYMIGENKGKVVNKFNQLDLEGRRDILNIEEVKPK